MRILEQMGTLWFFDMLAPEITFRFNGNRGIRTYFGIVLTVFYLACVTGFSYMITLTYLQTDSPMVVIDSNEAGKTHNIHLGENSLLPVFYMVINDKFYIPPESASTYFTLKFSKIKFRTVIQPDGKPGLEGQAIEMRILPCKELKKNATAFEYYSKWSNDKMFSQFALEYGLCIEGHPDELFIKGLGTDPELDALVFQVMPCSSGAACAPFSMAKNIAFISSSPISVLNNSNYHDPVKFTISSESYYYINEGLRQTYQPRISLTNIKDDSQSLSNLLGGKKQKANFFSYDKALQTSTIRSRDSTKTACSAVEVLFGQCEAFIQLEYLTSSKTVYISRVYKSLIRTLSEIGGINSFVFLFFYYINRLYCYFAYRKIMVNKVFEFFPEEDARRSRQSGRANAVGDSRQQKPDREASSDIYSKVLASLDDKAIARLRKEAFDMVQETIDVVYIAKEMMLLKTTLHYLMENQHRKVAPMISLLLRRKKVSRRQALRSKDKKSKIMRVGGSPDKAIEAEEIVDFYDSEDDDITMSAALRKLCNSDACSGFEAQQAQKRPQTSNPTKSSMDRFFFKNLVYASKLDPLKPQATGGKTIKRVSSMFQELDLDQKLKLKPEPSPALQEQDTERIPDGHESKIAAASQNHGKDLELPQPAFQEDFILNSDLTPASSLSKKQQTGPILGLKHEI